MRFVTFGAAAVALLMTCAVSAANVAPVVYTDDPGYARARAASVVAPFLTVSGLVLAGWWALRGTRLSTRLSASVFGLLVLGCAGLMALGSPPTEFREPGDTRSFAPWPRPSGPRSSRPTTPDETTVIWVLLLGLVCFGVPAVARRLVGAGSDEATAEPPHAPAEERSGG
ncbi:MAG: hypothetical protein K2V38_11080 [Gemmataceae bacterium]|nr:hypothetical protein [Gemmataceae bacterium]